MAKYGTFLHNGEIHITTISELEGCECPSLFVY